MLAPLTDLIAECGETKATKHTGTKKSPVAIGMKVIKKHLTDVKKTVGRDHASLSRLFETV